MRFWDVMRRCMGFNGDLMVIQWWFNVDLMVI
jgi:hypothetical protein